MLTDKRKEIIRGFLGVLIVGYDLLLLVPIGMFFQSYFEWGVGMNLIWLVLVFLRYSLLALPITLIVGFFHIRLKPMKKRSDYAFSFSPVLLSLLVVGIFWVFLFVIDVIEKIYG